jgi:hypothetical protein
MTEEHYRITYEFQFDGGNTKRFELPLDATTVTLVLPESNDQPEWTQLEYRQCSCCPLDPRSTPYCPLAVNIAELVEEFKTAISSDSCTVTCYTPERTYMKQTSIQDGLFSIFGIVMATSGCPILDFFKPMARFHLPFSSVQESVFRSTSIYLLRQYFEHKRGKRPDLDLDRLDTHYSKVQEVNHGLLHRTENIGEKDADTNAIVILNALAQLLSVEIEENLNSLEYLFTSD